MGHAFDHKALPAINNALDWLVARQAILTSRGAHRSADCMSMSRRASSTASYPSGCPMIHDLQGAAGRGQHDPGGGHVEPNASSVQRSSRSPKHSVRAMTSRATSASGRSDEGMGAQADQGVGDADAALRPRPSRRAWWTAA